MMTKEEINTKYGKDSMEARILRTELLEGRAKAIQRGVAYLCSNVLGRDFGESGESWEARQSESHKAFVKWFNQYREVR